MTDFQSTLLREKFVISEDGKGTEDALIALSNRLTLTLFDEMSGSREHFVLRTQNMHSCVRLGAQIAREFEKRGPLLSRPKAFAWQEMLAKIFDYEQKWNNDFWATIYVKGKPVSQVGADKHHPFLDIIEAYDERNKSDYEASLKMAEEAFMKAGKKVDIEYDSNVAMIATIKGSDEQAEGKCGLILRRAGRTNTFNINLRPLKDVVAGKKQNQITPARILSAGAALLEGIQLAFFIGMARYKISRDMISAHDAEYKQNTDAGKRIGQTNFALTKLESLFAITYRPERPDFALMIDEAEQFSKQAAKTSESLK